MIPPDTVISVSFAPMTRMEERPTILIADDEPDILEIISFNLHSAGYNVLTARNGNEAIELAKKNNPSLIILDVMMPDKTGIEVCRILRAKPEFKNTLIVYLTALNEESTEIRGLESGGDDYIVKPISPRLLISRVNALFRRLGKEDNERVIRARNLKIDLDGFAVYSNEEEIVLARKEFDLLVLLASHPGRVFLRDEILQRVWGTEVIVGDRTIDVHILKLRQKIGADFIQTVKGVGYKFQN